MTPTSPTNKLALALWTWSASVFAPALALRRMGVYAPSTLGTPPQAPGVPKGGGRDLSLRLTAPKLLEQPPEIYDSVVGFDECSDGYEGVVTPFSDPICKDAMAWLSPHLAPNCRILDPSCGPGTMAMRLARMFPEGEVVAADLSQGMVLTAHRKAREANLANMAFVQADVVSPPEELVGYFDAIFSCLSFHHYPDAAGAARAFRKVLGPQGVACIVDPGPPWFIALSKKLSVETDPGFVRHHTGEEFRELFTQAGFSSVFWVETLPGIGITLAQV